MDPLCPIIPGQGNAVPLPKFQMAPRLKLLLPFQDQEKEAKICLCAAKASHSLRMWDEVSSVPHLLPFQDQEKEAKICMSLCSKGFTLTQNVG